jgi:hypothetical protein
LRLLIIGDINNQYIENFSLSLKNYDNTIEIDIVNPVSIKEITCAKDSPYRKIFAYPQLNPLISKIPKLRGWINIRNLNKTIKHINENIDEYSVVLLQGFWLTHCYIFSRLNITNIFSIGAIWGSDFYKRQKEDKLFATIDKCNLVVISTEEMVKDVLKVKQIEKRKIRNCLFGLAPLQHLFEFQNITSKQSKKILGIEEDAFTILCGYNGSQNNQHLKIISEFSEIKSELPEKAKLILPITYGTTAKYKAELIKALETSGLEYIIYEDYLSDEQVAHLRKATELMVQIPVTDAFSGSFQEHLFAQNIVIAGNWLPYQSLKEKGIYYETIKNVGELREKLLFILHNLAEIKNKIEKTNTPDRFKASLWSECIKDWHSAISEYNS